jgi:hypothetical protein
MCERDRHGKQSCARRLEFRRKDRDADHHADNSWLSFCGSPDYTGSGGTGPGPGSSYYTGKRLDAMIEDVSVGTFLFLEAGQTAHFSHVSVPNAVR